MDEAKKMALDFKASDVEACRICLATDVRLYTAFQDTYLGICMESIGGFTKSYEGLPNYVCYECGPILIKCYKLKEKAKVAEATLLDIFNEKGQIDKRLIQEQKKTKLDLQSSLDSYLLQNYFYIKYDDDSNTSDFTKTESDPNEKINLNFKNEVEEESVLDVLDGDIEKMLKELTKEEELDKGSDVEADKGSDVEADKDSDVEADKDSDVEADKDSDVEAIEMDVPVVEIVSDDEKIGDDFISLKSYNVKMDNVRRVKGLLARHDDIPQYYKPKNVRPIGVAKKAKKYKKKKTVPVDISPYARNDNYIKRYFNIHPTPSRMTSMEYSCKHCPETFNYAFLVYKCERCCRQFTSWDDARDHTFIGCQKPQRSYGDTSTVPNPGSEFNSVPPSRMTPMEYSCKHCPETFNDVDDAIYHTLIGCPKSQRSYDHTSTVPNPGSEFNSVPPSRMTPMEYSCKHCPETFNDVDDAIYHTLIGCPKSQRSYDHTSTVPNPGSEFNSVPKTSDHQFIRVGECSPESRK